MVGSANGSTGTVAAWTGWREPLVRTDGIMPGVGSPVLVDEFLRRYPGAPVLVCSGHLETDLLRRGIRVGEYAFLAKPCTGKELIERVEGLLLAAEDAALDAD